MAMNKKNLILETASELFYSEGYSNTSFESIANKCSISKQAITYHFGTKEQLGVAVCTVFGATQKSTFDACVTRQTGETDPLLLSAAFELWQGEFYKNDPKAYRFFEEFVYTTPEFDLLIGNIENEYYQTMDMGDLKKLSESQMKLKTISIMHSGKGLIYEYGRNRLVCDKDEFAKFLLYNYFSAFFSEEKMAEMYRKAKMLLDSVTIEILPEYRVR